MTPVRPSRAQKSVYERLRVDILGGRHEPGVPLVEAALAEQYGVSRTPIREALLQLLRDGLVERAGRGVAVVARTPEEVLEIYEVRVLLESAAARLASIRRTDLDLSMLARAHERMEENSQADSATKARLNAEFHQQCWSASHNATLADLLRRVYELSGRYPERTLDHPGRWEAVLREHAELLTAIRDQDADAAEQIAHEHMAAARNTRLEMFAQSLGEVDVMRA